MKTTHLEQNIDRFEKALRGCLAEVPFIQIVDAERSSLTVGGPADIVLKLKSPERKWLLLVEAKASGQPRVAREGINQLLRYREFLPYDYAVLAAPYISPRAAEICAKEGVGYADLAGNCRLSFGQVFIQKEGRPNPFSQKRDLRSLYSPKAERVLRVLLLDPAKKWKMESLAEEAGVSLGQVANVKKLLADREWVGTEKDGFCLNHPEALLAEWSQNYSFRRNRVDDYYSLKSVGEIESELAEVCDREGIDYALTGFSGAARVAPSVRYQRAVAYVKETERLATSLRLKRVPSGANVTLLEPYDEGVFNGARDIDGARVVSLVQLYLDLKGFRGRGEEAADAVLEEVIKPRWQSGGQITRKS